MKDDFKKAHCGRKRQYTTKREAKKIINKIRRSNKKKGTLEVYGCKFCGFYHVGNSGWRENEKDNT